MRVPQAVGALVPLPVEADSSLLTLSDLLGTGHHGAVTAGARPGTEQIVFMDRHTDRTDLGRPFGATDVVAERGEEGAARVHDLTGGDSVAEVIEAVGTRLTLETALAAVDDGGTISRLGVPQCDEGPVGQSMIMRNVTLTGGASPARAYIDGLLPDVLDGTIHPRSRLRPGRHPRSRPGRLAGDDRPSRPKALITL
ncbi:zinc-binding dehydrogenase [Amycolatopsis sp. A133]|uniref:zinc-binding dehydrogenase n=1 Tax=Amycolatopsis sp. A133 TaxID=3064472 RepID=UPI0027F41799|nr:zinc-binding dehydrogenase [Amycolatopsis sp. A133]MDQ7809125.1 zinc-binding dehydrogenase [Amycolatopsis sp. A133]